MSYFFPEGSKFFFSNTFATAVAIASLSNAAMAVAGAVGHGYVDGDELLVALRLGRCHRHGLQGRPADGGHFRPGRSRHDRHQLLPGWHRWRHRARLSAWTEIPQILTINSQGGSVFTAVKPLSRRNGFQVPVGSNPESVNIVMGHDASNANYKSMLAISRRLSKCAFKQVISGGAVTYGYGYSAYVTERPSMNNDQPNSVTAAISVIGRTISY